MNLVASPMQRCLLLMVALLWAVPPLMVRHTKPISTFYSEFAALSVFVIIIFMIQTITFRERKYRDIAKAVSIPVGYLCVLFVQLAVLRLTQPMSLFIAVGYGLCAAMAIQAGYRLSQMGLTDRVAVVIAYALVLTALISVLIVFVQAFRTEDRLFGIVAVYEIKNARRLFGNMFQPNHLASVLCMGMAGACYLRASNWMGIKFQVVVLISIGVAIAFTGSRMPWIQISVVTILNCFLLARFRANSHEKPFVRNAIEIGFPLIAMILGSIVASAMNRFLDLQLTSIASRIANEGQLVGRGDIWRYAWRMFMNHPLLGIGWGEFTISQYRLADTMGAVEASGNAHNIFLDILAKTGLLGLILTVVPLIAWCLRVRHSIFRGERFEQQIFFFMLLGIFAVHAMLEYPQAYAFFLLPACLLIGLCEPAGRVIFTAAMSKTVSAVFSLLLMFGLVLAMRDYRRVEGFYEINGPLKYALAPSFIFGDWGRFGLAGLLELNDELLDQKIKLHEYALGIATTPDNIRRYAILLALAGRPDSAMLQVRRLMALYPVTGRSEYQLLLAMCNDADVRLKQLKTRLIADYGSSAHKAK